MTSNEKSPTKSLAMLLSPRCGARTRKGTPCQAPAVAGKKRCRMHGGATGSGAPRGNRNAWKHGEFDAASRELKRRVRQAYANAMQSIKGVKSP